MRTLQGTLDAIIDAGLYNPEKGYMCSAAKAAVCKKVITRAEYDALILSIGLYIANVTGGPALMITMRYVCCIAKGRTSTKASPEELLNLYRNWTNRPRWNRGMRRKAL